MAASVETNEGFAPFEHQQLPKPCSTWYKIAGQLDGSSTGRPLICVHGGPGACHNYLLPLQELAHKHGITLIFYDQVGCGKSTRLRETRLDTALWTVDLFIAELQNLLKHLNVTEYDLLGQSWGGMLGSEFGIRQPEGLHRLIIANSPASMKLWVDACNECRAELPPEIEATLEKYERLRDYENQDYKNAVTSFYKRHFCLLRGKDDIPFPPDVMDTMDQLEADDTVYFTMNGPSEFTVIGNLKTWTVEGRLSKIRVPTFVYNGEFDEARTICVRPFAEEIPNNVWKTFPGTSHVSHVEKPEVVCQSIADFLNGKKLEGTN